MKATAHLAIPCAAETTKKRSPPSSPKPWCWRRWLAGSAGGRGSAPALAVADVEAAAGLDLLAALVTISQIDHGGRAAPFSSAASSLGRSPVSFVRGLDWSASPQWGPMQSVRCRSRSIPDPPLGFDLQRPAAGGRHHRREEPGLTKQASQPLFFCAPLYRHHHHHHMHPPITGLPCCCRNGGAGRAAVDGWLGRRCFARAVHIVIGYPTNDARAATRSYSLGRRSAASHPAAREAPAAQGAAIDRFGTPFGGGGRGGACGRLCDAGAFGPIAASRPPTSSSHDLLLLATPSTHSRTHNQHTHTHRRQSGTARRDAAAKRRDVVARRARARASSPPPGPLSSSMSLEFEQQKKYDYKAVRDHLLIDRLSYRSIDRSIDLLLGCACAGAPQ